MPVCSALSKRAGPALHGTMFARFGHVYTATANRAEPAGTASSLLCAGTVSSYRLSKNYIL